MSRHNRPEPPSEPVRRIEAGPWAIELLPSSAYAARFVATQPVIGFAFDSQRGIHAIGSDRVHPFSAMPNTLAFVPAGCDVLSESPTGGEYLRVMRSDDRLLNGDHVFNNRIDQQVTAIVQRMRSALLCGSTEDDWEAWALALAERIADGKAVSSRPPGGITANRMRLLDEFIDANLGGPLDVKAMAGLLGLSEGYFMRAFKNTTGKSPHSYLIDRRLARARALMRISTGTLTWIAQNCGFSSHAHMTTVFKQRLGVSPAQLRKGGQ